MNDTSSPSDHDMTQALSRFARTTAGDGVSVVFDDGVVHLRGRVASATQAAALEDLLRWHDRVARVDSELEIETAAELRIPPAS